LRDYFLNKCAEACTALLHKIRDTQLLFHVEIEAETGIRINDDGTVVKPSVPQAISQEFKTKMRKILTIFERISPKLGFMQRIIDKLIVRVYPPLAAKITEILSRMPPLQQEGGRNYTLQSNNLSLLQNTQQLYSKNSNTTRNSNVTRNSNNNIMHIAKELSPTIDSMYELFFQIQSTTNIYNNIANDIAGNHNSSSNSNISTNSANNNKDIQLLKDVYDELNS